MEEETKKVTPLKAIKDHCKYDCCCIGSDNDGGTDAWKNCEATDCKLWHFRFGKNPFRKRKDMTDEQRQAIAERLKNSRGK